MLSLERWFIVGFGEADVVATIGSVGLGNEVSQGSQPASAKVRPGRAIEFDHRRCWPWE
jgi:hypothetical protein